MRPSAGPAIALFFTTPLLAEYLRGDLPVRFLPAIIALAPLYGGGALLIREVAGRTQKGWPAIIVLGMAFAIFEEAFTTQSLFNPNYLHLHLLAPAHIRLLGISAWWTLWMLNVHPVWSIATPIALIEACVPLRARSSWLGAWGIAIVAVLCAFGAVLSAVISLRQDPFVASRSKLASAAVVCLALVAVVSVLPTNREPTTCGWIPSPLMAGVFALGLGSLLQLVPSAWGWLAFLLILICDLFALVAIWTWSRRIGWNLRHQFALAGGAALAYGWDSFLQQPVVPTPPFTARASNATFMLGAVCLIWFAMKRCSANIAVQQGE